MERLSKISCETSLAIVLEMKKGCELCGEKAKNRSAYCLCCEDFMHELYWCLNGIGGVKNRFSGVISVERKREGHGWKDAEEYLSEHPWLLFLR